MTTDRPRQRSAHAPDHEAAIAGAPYLRHRRTHRSRSHPRPRVLQLLATGGSGGAQESYTGLLLRVDRARYEVRALSLSAGSAVQRLRRLGLEVEVLDEPDDEAAVRELAAYLRRHEIDLVHAHMFRAEVLGVRAALAAGTPVIVATVHSSRVRSAGDVAALAALTPSMDRLIVPSAAIAAKVAAEGRGGASFAVIPNGVDLSRFDVPPPACGLRRQLGVPRDGVLVGVVARLEPEKGHRHLLEAWPLVVAEAPHTWLAIVGEGSEEAALRAAALALPARARERVSFTGRRDDVAAITAELDIAVLPSLREAQGISVLEAMARRRAVVASAVGGIPEVVTDGASGLLVPPGEPAALAAALVRLACSPDLRRRMGEAGHATVVERFSIDAQVRRIQALYDEELDRAGV
ncbi:MAG: glycosyltransferase, partial [Candidatus Limnocylindria bacterium]